MDSFCEYLVKRKQKTSEKVICTLLIIFAICFTAFAFLYLFPLVHSLFRDAASFIFPLVVAVWYVILIFTKRYNVEFEYALTGSDMDVDKIINKRKRQKVLSASLRQLTIAAPKASEHYKEEYKNLITYDCSTGIDEENTYFAVYTVEGQKKCVIFNPTEKMINHMKIYCKEVY